MRTDEIRKAEMKRWFLQESLVLLLSFFLGGCYQSDAPLSRPNASNSDERLLGLWHSKIDGNDVYLHVIAMDKPWLKLIKIVHINHGGISENTEVDMFPTKIGEDRFVNLKFRKTNASKEADNDSGKSADAYWFYKYDIAPGGVMTVWTIEYAAVKEAIERGTLKGRAWETTWMDNLTLIDSSDRLADFLTQVTGEKYKVLGRFKRMQEVP